VTTLPRSLVIRALYSTALSTPWLLYANASAQAQQPASSRTTARAAAPFSVVEASMTELQAALAAKRVTSRQLVEQYLVRIATYDQKLRATITVNPRALAEADALDRERAQGKVRGPMHGIPVALKDNIHTADMRTTGGALAFTDLVPPYDATLTKNLRDAGAIVIAKAQLTELANWVASGMPGNYNAVNGQGLNPWDPRTDPRPGLNDGRAVMGTGGSSSGIGTNVSFWAGNVGTETSGSILSPAHANALVGIKPTVGRISRYGVIPITADQDTPGPMTRTVADAAIFLGAMEGAAPDPNDAATKACTPPANRDYTPFLKADALKGARIGIPRAFFYDTVTSGGSTRPRGGLSPAQRRVMDEVIGVLRAQGATVVDPVNIPSITARNADDNLLDWNPCSGLDNARGLDGNCSIVLKYGMKRDFNAWLGTLGNKAPLASLTALRQWNLEHQRGGAIKYGQAQLDISDEIDVRLDRERYEADRKKDLRLTATQGIDAVMKEHTLDALLFPGASSANIAARPGYPSITVPYALLPVTATGAQAFPAGFDPKPAPFGITFTAGACAEPKLVALSYAFEQATRKRQTPAGFP
jgi:amidase